MIVRGVFEIYGVFYAVFSASYVYEGCVFGGLLALIVVDAPSGRDSMGFDVFGRLFDAVGYAFGDYYSEDYK